MQQVQAITGGIYVQMIRNKEEEARGLVTEARRRMKHRMRQARVEAELEIKDFRKRIESQFHLKCQQLAVIDEKKRQDCLKLAQVEVDRIHERATLCAPKILELLDNLVTDFKPAVHHNMTARRRLESLTTRLEDRSSFAPIICHQSTLDFAIKCLVDCENLVTAAEESQNSQNSIVDSRQPTVDKNNNTKENLV